SQLGAAGQVLRRRGEWLRRQSRGLRAPPQLGEPALPGRGDGILPRCGGEQLHVEPRVDVSPSAWTRRVPGPSIPERVARRVRREPRAAQVARRGRAREDRFPGDRDRARDAAQLPRQQALVVPEKALTRLLLAAAAVLVAATFTSTAQALPTVPVYDSNGRLGQTPFAPPQAPARLTQAPAHPIFLPAAKGADWLARYPKNGPQVSATYQAKPESCTAGTSRGCWNLRADWDPAGEIASGRVDDSSGRVTEAWTGPQVAWKMARGGKGAFGGVKINSYSVWLGFCFAFLLGLAEFRRPLSWRNLDLLMLLSFSVSLWFFNRRYVFASGSPVYVPLACLLARCAWIGWTGRAARGRVVWPYWVLLAGAVFLAGFRIGLNVEDSNVIDVGYAGVIGAERISSGQSPYCHFPVEAE